jgi:neutral trehalase
LAEYSAKAAALREAVHELMYDRNGTGVWFDWDLQKKAQRKRSFYPSNIFPLTLLNHLFPNANERKKQCARVVAYLDREGVLSMAGNKFKIFLC